MWKLLQPWKQPVGASSPFSKDLISKMLLSHTALGISLLNQILYPKPSKEDGSEPAPGADHSRVQWSRRVSGTWPFHGAKQKNSAASEGASQTEPAQPCNGKVLPGHPGSRTTSRYPTACSSNEHSWAAAAKSLGAYRDGPGNERKYRGTIISCMVGICAFSQGCSAKFLDTLIPVQMGRDRGWGSLISKPSAVPQPWECHHSHPTLTAGAEQTPRLTGVTKASPAAQG